MELGTKIVGDFGGYTELWNGEVVTISTYDTGPSTPEVKVRWDNGSTTWMCASVIVANKGLKLVIIQRGRIMTLKKKAVELVVGTFFMLTLFGVAWFAMVVL